MFKNRIVIILFTIIILTGCGITKSLESMQAEYGEIEKASDRIEEKLYSDCYISYEKNNGIVYLEIYIQSPPDDLKIIALKRIIEEELSTIPNFEYNNLSIIIGDPIFDDDF